MVNVPRLSWGSCQDESLDVVDYHTGDLEETASSTGEGLQNDERDVERVCQRNVLRNETGQTLWVAEHIDNLGDSARDT